MITAANIPNLRKRPFAIIYSRSLAEFWEQHHEAETLADLPPEAQDEWARINGYTDFATYPREADRHQAELMWQMVMTKLTIGIQRAAILAMIPDQEAREAVVELMDY